MPAKSPTLDNDLQRLIQKVTDEAIAKSVARVRNGDLVAPEFATPRQLAQITGIPFKTLEAWRARGYGPPYISLTDGPKSRKLYRLSAVREWRSAHETDANA